MILLHIIIRVTNKNSMMSATEDVIRIVMQNMEYLGAGYVVMMVDAMKPKDVQGVKQSTRTTLQVKFQVVILTLTKEALAAVVLVILMLVTMTIKRIMIHTGTSRAQPLGTKGLLAALLLVILTLATRTKIPNGTSRRHPQGTQEAMVIKILIPIRIMVTMRVTRLVQVTTMEAMAEQGMIGVTKLPELTLILMLTTTGIKVAIRTIGATRVTLVMTQGAMVTTMLIAIRTMVTMRVTRLAQVTTTGAMEEQGTTGVTKLAELTRILMLTATGAMATGPLLCLGLLLTQTLSI